MAEKTTKAPAKKAPAKAKAPVDTHDTRQTNRRTRARADVDQARAGDGTQPRHMAGTGSAGAQTVGERVGSGENVGTQKGVKPSLSVSAPLAAGTQLFVTGHHFPSRSPAVVEIDGPVHPERRSLRTDPFGQVQVALHSPTAGKHTVTIKVGKAKAKISFDVA